MEEWRGGRAVWTVVEARKIVIWFAFGRGPDRPLQARPSAWDSLAGHTLVDHFASRVWRYCAGRGGGGVRGVRGSGSEAWRVLNWFECVYWV